MRGVSPIQTQIIDEVLFHHQNVSNAKPNIKKCVYQENVENYIEDTDTIFTPLQDEYYIQLAKTFDKELDKEPTVPCGRLGCCCNENGVQRGSRFSVYLRGQSPVPPWIIEWMQMSGLSTRTQPPTQRFPRAHAVQHGIVGIDELIIESNEYIYHGDDLVDGRPRRTVSEIRTSRMTNIYNPDMIIVPTTPVTVPTPTDQNTNQIPGNSNNLTSEHPRDTPSNFGNNLARAFRRSGGLFGDDDKQSEKKKKPNE